MAIDLTPSQLQKKIAAMTRLHREQMDKQQVRLREMEQRVAAAEHQRELAERRERAAVLENLHLTRQLAEYTRRLKALGALPPDEAE